MLSPRAFIKALKNMGQILFGNTRPVIGDGRNHLIIFHAAGQPDFIFRVTDRIGNEVAEQPLRVLLADRQQHRGIVNGKAERDPMSLCLHALL